MTARVADENLTKELQRMSVTGKVGGGGASGSGSGSGASGGKSSMQSTLPPRGAPLSKIASSSLHPQAGASGSGHGHGSSTTYSASSSLLRKGSVDRMNANYTGSHAMRMAGGGLPTSSTKGTVSSSAAAAAGAAFRPPKGVVDIGKYDGSLERDEKRGRRSGDVRGGLLDFDARQLAVPPQKQWTLSDFELGHPLGKGKFGRVYVARTRPGTTPGVKAGYIIALKALYKDEIRKEGLELQVRRELEIQMNLRHPHVLRLHGFFHDEGRIFMMLEFAGKGELYKIMSKLPDCHFDEGTAAKVSAKRSCQWQ